jgi:hypothetical protein
MPQARPQLRRRLATVGVILFFLSSGGVGCRFRSKAPYWIETHGHALGNRIAGWALGVLLLGGDGNLWGYPGPWDNPLVAKARTRPLRAITAAHTAVYALLSDGHVARFTGSSWSMLEGSNAWGTSELAVTEDDQLLVLSGGKLRSVAGRELKELSCDSHPDLVGLAAVRPDEAFVIDQAGALYFNGGGHCDAVPAPLRLRRIAANTSRLLAVAADGSVWRRRENVWVKLPIPFKNRPGLPPAAAQPEDVGLSAYSSWLVDTEGSVYVLSDEA